MVNGGLTITLMFLLVLAAAGRVAELFRGALCVHGVLLILQERSLLALNLLRGQGRLRGGGCLGRGVRMAAHHVPTRVGSSEA